jgi:hypothetical protein
VVIWLEMVVFLPKMVVFLAEIVIFLRKRAGGGHGLGVGGK